MEGRAERTTSFFAFLFFAVLTLAAAGGGAGQPPAKEPNSAGRETPEVVQIRVDGAITPPVASFIAESVGKSAVSKSSALLVLLDTPGGLDTSMRQIVKAILDSPVPVFVFVFPSGSRVASAGTIILLAAHVAAMAPGTNVGTTHPVAIGKDKVDKE